MKNKMRQGLRLRWRDRVNDAGKIHMLNAVYKEINTLCGFLPQYEFNENKEMKSVTEFLKRFELGMSAVAFNALLVKHKYLIIRTSWDLQDITHC